MSFRISRLSGFVAAALVTLGCQAPADILMTESPSLGRAPANSGAVERGTSVNGFIFRDEATSLTASIGFDRPGWCAAGPGAEIRDFLTPVERQLVSHADGRETLTLSQRDAGLVLYEGAFGPAHLTSCAPVVVVGEGVGSFNLARVRPAEDGGPPFVSSSGIEGWVEVDGKRRQVLARGQIRVHVQDGEVVSVRNTRVRVSG